ncbi:MAG: EamA family transporter RarD [Acidimicrobiia bacterium]|nr:EamA family transporter RarD [Acidimicrobiia bacterium]
MNRGVALGIGAYVLWGVLPIYWKALEAVGSVEILAHRIVWSMVLLVAIVGLRRSWPQIRSLRRSSMIRLLIAGTLLTLNWATYIWAVNNGHIVESSLGYFINPLLNVALGVVILHERLDKIQWLAIGLAAAGVIYMTIAVGALPWIALVLATSFGMYALLKKQMLVLGPFESLTVEIGLVLVPALIFLAALAMRGEGSFGTGGTRLTLLLLFTGVATALPLLLFGAAATRIRLSTIGLLQYIAPSMQFLIGVFVYNEVVGRDRLVGFILVWIALAIYTGNGLARRLKVPEPAPL